LALGARLLLVFLTLLVLTANKGFFMNRKYIAFWLALLTLLLIFPPCVGRGYGYSVGHVFILNVGTYVDVPTQSGTSKYLSFIAEIAWQKLLIEVLGITSFVAMLRAFKVFEFLFNRVFLNPENIENRNLMTFFNRLLNASIAIAFCTPAIFLVYLLFDGGIGAWGYLVFIVLPIVLIPILSKLKRF
jgi:hypothetical protein